MIRVINSKGYTLGFEALQGVLDFFGAEEGTAIITDTHSEYGLSLFASDDVDFEVYFGSLDPFLV